jgi:hypothetical protein
MKHHGWRKVAEWEFLKIVWGGEVLCVFNRLHISRISRRLGILVIQNFIVKEVDSILVGRCVCPSVALILGSGVKKESHFSIRKHTSFWKFSIKML